MVTALRHANTKVFNTSHLQAGTMSPSLPAVVAGTKYWNNEGASACQEHYAQLRSKRHGHNLTGASSYVLFSEQALAATRQGTCMLALQTEVEDARYIHSRRAFAADNLLSWMEYRCMWREIRTRSVVRLREQECLLAT